MIALVAGTRPEIIKLAPVYAALRKRRMNPQFVLTGQSPDLAGETFSAFDMRPDVELALFRMSGSLPELMTGLAAQAAGYLAEQKPEAVLVQGDTLSAAVWAQQAFLAGVKVGHVEAGLRSWNVKSPYPEEACRVWIDAVADWKFAPTEGARHTLDGEVWVTGNTVMDALSMVKPRRIRSGRYASTLR